MEAEFNIWETNRKHLKTFLDTYSTEQLNKIPVGFNNNLIWNIAHIIVVQQSLVYLGSGLKANIPDSMIDRYKPGTFVNGYVEKDEIENIKELLISLIDQTKSDYHNKVLKSYQKRELKSGFKIHSIEDAITFNNYHEGMHFGYIMSIKKFV